MSGSPYSYEELPSLIGKELGVSPWITVDQGMIDGFADVTHDHQWIHVNKERAGTEGPYGTTVAHGYLTLSLLAPLSDRIGMYPRDTAISINYGLDRVRFLNPVKSGARIRLRAKLTGLDLREKGQYLMRVSSTVEIEGDDRPALIAENLVLLVPESKG